MSLYNLSETALNGCACLFVWDSAGMEEGVQEVREMELVLPLLCYLATLALVGADSVQ